MGDGMKLAGGIGFAIFILLAASGAAQNYEVAEIDCAVGVGGKELLTARLRRPDGFRGLPIFADDRGWEGTAGIPHLPDHIQRLTKAPLDDAACQIYPDPLEPSGRVFVLKVTDFSQCGVLKRDGFINVRVWFPQLHGVVMLSDQEVIIMCKPPQSTVTQSKAAGFAGTIPQGARVSGVVEERPGHLEYEVALFRETTSSNGGRSVVSGQGASAYLTGLDSQQLPVDQAVPIGTRLQLRAKISPNSAWHHAKLMDVSVSPDPKNPDAHGSVALVKNGCRNPDLASIIPKQPYRLEDRTNEVVLDFEAFLLSNMGERNTLWLHTQIKACMEPTDCLSEVCIMDIYQASSYGRRKRRSPSSSQTQTLTGLSGHNETVLEFSAPLSRHWAGLEGPSRPAQLSQITEPKKGRDKRREAAAGRSEGAKGREIETNTKFGDNIGFSVIMPPDYYRTTRSMTEREMECRGWALGTLIALSLAMLAAIFSCILGARLRRMSKEHLLSTYSHLTPTPKPKETESHHHHHHAPIGRTEKCTRTEYARDPSLNRP